MLKNQKGIILITAYLVIVVLLILGSSFVTRSLSERRISEREKSSIQTFYLAEAGFERGMDWLRAQPNPPEGTDVFDPLGGTVTLGGGNYRITIDPDDSNPGVFLKKYSIISTGSIGDTTRGVVAEVQVDSFARYAYFTDDEHFRWGWWLIPVWFVTGDYLTGPVHSNSHFHIYGNPVFAGPVTTADDYIQYYQGGPPLDNPDFQQGIEFEVSSIQMPASTVDMETKASSGGLLLRGDTTVELQSDGTMNVTNANEGWVNQNMSLPANGVLYVDDGSLNISGTLNGQLTAGSEENIVITDNILYNTDPRLDPTSQDVLGLVSEENVVISQNAPFDVEVDATIMALDDSFTVERWWQGPAKGTLTLYGGLIQGTRGPVGTFSGSTGEKLSGYSKDYYYDFRLMANPPPFYPTTGDYVILSWREE